MLSRFPRLMLAMSNFLVGMAMFAVICTVTVRQLPQFGDVARFLPMLIGSTISYPLILFVRARGRLFSVRWITAFAIPMVLLSAYFDGLGQQPWLLLVSLALVMAVIQSGRSLRSDIAEESGPLGDVYLIWADLGYGFGTAFGILMWASDLGNLGSFESALTFSCVAFLFAVLLDCYVAHSRTSGSSDGATDVVEYVAGDANRDDRESAKWSMARWAALIPLIAVAIQATIMRQSDRFKDFFSYMSFDIGTVIAGVILAMVVTVRISDTPFIPPDYVPSRRRKCQFSDWEKVKVRWFGIRPWLGIATGSMLLGFACETVGLKVGECLAYGLAGFMFEALWLVLLGWLASSSRFFGISNYISVSGTIGSAILAVTLAYTLMSYFKDVHPIWFSVPCLMVSFGLLYDRRPRAIPALSKASSI